MEDIIQKWVSNIVAQLRKFTLYFLGHTNLISLCFSMFSMDLTESRGHPHRDNAT